VLVSFAFLLYRVLNLFAAVIKSAGQSRIRAKGQSDGQFVHGAGCKDGIAWGSKDDYKGGAKIGAKV
jgi:hypothetical protein